MEERRYCALISFKLWDDFSALTDVFIDYKYMLPDPYNFAFRVQEDGVFVKIDTPSLIYVELG